jgi:uncharacterized protein YbaR (Trm112 family)
MSPTAPAECPPDGHIGEPRASSEAAPTFDRRMLEALVCPVTRGPLSYDPERQELISNAAHLAYPIRDGIPLMVASEARETG